MVVPITLSLYVSFEPLPGQLNPFEQPLLLHMHCFDYRWIVDNVTYVEKFNFVRIHSV